MKDSVEKLRTHLAKVRTELDKELDKIDKYLSEIPNKVHEIEFKLTDEKNLLGGIDFPIFIGSKTELINSSVYDILPVKAKGRRQHTACTRARNALSNRNIRTVGQLVSLDEEELMRKDAVGKTTVLIIKECLKKNGLRLGMSDEVKRLTNVYLHKQIESIFVKDNSPLVKTILEKFARCKKANFAYHGGDLTVLDIMLAGRSSITGEGNFQQSDSSSRLTEKEYAHLKAKLKEVGLKLSE